MKFKMRENSVFGILLRSSWWISALIALGVIGAAGALMPPKYAPIGMMSALPFMVIAVMVLWRTRNAPDPARLQSALSHAAQMPWRAFAAKLDAAYTAQGFAVTHLADSQAQGADLRLDKNDHITLVSAKRYKAAKHGVEPLRELLAAKDRLAAQHCIYICLADVTDQAALLAKQEGIELVQGQRLAAILM